MPEKESPPPQAPEQGPSRNWQPIPDPTVLTTQSILREIAMLRDVLEMRFSGLEKQVEVNAAAIEKTHGHIDTTVKRLQELHEEKFRSIAVQFAERDIRTEQTSRDSKVAVDAALQAAKEAVGEQNKSSALAIAKSEAATTKQIDQIGVIINTMANGLNDKIDDIKTRLTSLEGRASGIKDVAQPPWSLVVGIVGALIAAGAIIALIALRPH